MQKKQLLILPYFDIFGTGGMETSTRRLVKNISKLGWCGVIVNDASKHNYKKYKKFYNFDLKYVFPITPKWPSLKKPYTFLQFWLKNLARIIITTDMIKTRDIKLLYVLGPPNLPVTCTFNIFPFWKLLKRFRKLNVVIGVRGAGSAWVPTEVASKLFLIEELSQLKAADKFTCVDHYILYHHYPKQFEAKGVVITNSVDVEHFYPKYNMAKRNLVLFVGHLTKERGVCVFLEAAKILQHKDYKFVIVGGNHLEKVIRRYLKRASLKNVELWGVQPHSKMPDIYNQAAVVVNPLPSEGLGNITIEAMACGKCVIRTRSKVRDYVLVDCVNSILFERNNAVDLASKIELALKNTNLRRGIELNARKTALELFTEDIETKKYDSLFSSLLTEQSGRKCVSI